MIARQGVNISVAQKCLPFALYLYIPKHPARLPPDRRIIITDDLSVATPERHVQNVHHPMLSQMRRDAISVYPWLIVTALDHEFYRATLAAF